MILVGYFSVGALCVVQSAFLEGLDRGALAGEFVLLPPALYDRVRGVKSYAELLLALDGITLQEIPPLRPLLRSSAIESIPGLAPRPTATRPRKENAVGRTVTFRHEIGTKVRHPASGAEGEVIALQLLDNGAQQACVRNTNSSVWYPEGELEAAAIKEGSGEGGGA